MLTRNLTSTSTLTSYPNRLEGDKVAPGGLSDAGAQRLARASALCLARHIDEMAELRAEVLPQAEVELLAAAFALDDDSLSRPNLHMMPSEAQLARRRAHFLRDATAQLSQRSKTLSPAWKNAVRLAALYVKAGQPREAQNCLHDSLRSPAMRASVEQDRSSGTRLLFDSAHPLWRVALVCVQARDVATLRVVLHAGLSELIEKNTDFASDLLSCALLDGDLETARTLVAAHVLLNPADALHLRGHAATFVSKIQQPNLRPRDDDRRRVCAEMWLAVAQTASLKGTEFRSIRTWLRGTLWQRMTGDI